MTDQRSSKTLLKTTTLLAALVGAHCGPPPDDSEIAQRGASARLSLEAAYAPGGIQVDGQIDGAWSRATRNNLSRVVVGELADARDLAAEFSLLWADDDLFALFRVADERARGDSQLPWHDDAVELYLDLNANGGKTYDANDFHFVVRRGGAAITETAHGATQGVRAAARAASDGFVVELQIPWATLGKRPTEGMRLGLDAMVDDDDDGGNRDAQLSWNSVDEFAYRSPDRFGSAQLGRKDAGSDGGPEDDPGTDAGPPRDDDDQGPGEGGGVAARAAHDFVNSVGLNTHFSWNTANYATRFNEVKAALSELGVRHIRGMPGNSAVWPRYAALTRELGVRLNLTIDTRSGSGAAARLDPRRIAEQLAVIDQHIGVEHVSAIEGPNEYDNMKREHGYNGWAADLRAYTQQLYPAARGSALGSGPVLGPSIAARADDAIAFFSALGNLGSVTDGSSLHIYGNWRSLQAVMDSIIVPSRIAFPSGQIRITEYGWHMATSAQNVDQATRAKYLLRGMATIAKRNDVERGYIYQLLDPFDDSRTMAPSPWQPTYRMTAAHFGLMRLDLSKTPAFFAVRNIMRILCDDPHANPESLRFELSGQLQQVETLLLHKRNGAFYLLLWQERQSFDQRRVVPVAPQRVTVSFGEPVALARVYLPSAPTDVANRHQPVATLTRTNPTQVTVEVPDHVLVLEVVPEGVATPAVANTCTFRATR